MNTPVLFLVFNRPATTALVFEEIRKIKPRKLYVAADGPRVDRPKEAILCNETRAILKRVDWDCELKTLFRDSNLGCRNAVSSAIDWFFEQEECGIILEDDCLPHPTFFRYCEVMLERYYDDRSVVHIGGVNFQRTKIGDGDYYYSNLTHVWGWASWRRVWQNYDVNMKKWPPFRDADYLRYIFPKWKVHKHLTFSFENTFRSKINTWDYQYFFSNLVNHGLSVIPNVNLISNIGFSRDATHTTENHPYANAPVYPMETFVAPTIKCAHTKADLETLDRESPGNIAMLKSSLLSTLRKLIKQKEQ